MYFSAISTISLVAIIAGLSNALPLSTPIAARTGQWDYTSTPPAKDPSATPQDITIPVTVPVCLGIAVCNPVTANGASD
ncbi:hypothetical protein DSL72_002793 [Monilinia vaccinii-corymbosi]|uniref:Hydrophobin n=1 Tax=Monilinia vaccinii-corymbosi TaxID=61207 RepID=A0A8A3PDG8_9HELO|nr:hypothetical protein DSL72_002793 [Monilinia vaccinii-corymbosi]